MQKKIFFAAVVILLLCIAGFLALDRLDKLDHAERSEKFDQSFAK